MKKIVIALDDFDRLKSPYEILTYSDIVFYSCLFQGIVTYSDGKIIPALCDTYEILENGARYIFTFGCKKWSNGERISAYNFADLFRFLLKNYREYACAEQLLIIRGAADYIEGKCMIDQIGINVNGDKLDIALEYENYDFLDILSSCIYSPIYYKISDSNLLNVTNGAYFLKTVDEKNKEITVKRNPYFYVSSNVGEIVFKVLDSAEEQVSLFRNKKLDITCNTLYEKQVDNNVIVYESPLKYFLYINPNLKFNYCEREELYKRVAEVNWASLSAPLNNDSSFVIKINHLDFFHREKKSFSIGNKKCKLLYADFYPNMVVAKKISEILREFGYDLLLEKADYKLFPKYIDRNEYKFILSILTPPYIAPSAILGMFVDSIELEERKDEYISLMCDYFEASMDKSRRDRILIELEKILRQKLPVIPVCRLNGMYKKRDIIKGFEYKIDGTPTYEKINICEE